MSLLQKLAQATGKSVDEIAEYFGKKGGQAPSVPIGSGKNLEALQQAKIGAPNLDDLKAYPKNISQDDLAARGGFSLEGEPFTKDFTMPHPEATVPAIRGNTLPVAGDVIEESTESMLPALSKGTAPEVIEASFKQIPEETVSRFKRMDPRLAGVAAAMGLGIGGASMFSDDGDVPEIPFRPKEQAPEPKSVLPDNYNQLAQDEALNQEIALPPKSPTAPKEVKPTTPEQEQYDFVKMMMAAQETGNQNQFMNTLLRAANQAGAAFGSLGAGSQVKADYSGVDALDKTARQGVADVTKLMETKQGENKLKQMEKELTDDKTLRDPNSSVSKMTKDVLARHGINVSSAKEAQLAGINIQNIILQELAAKNQKEIKAMEVESSKIKKEKDLTSKQREFAKGLRKELTSGVLGKQYSTFATGQRMQNALEQFAQDPTGYSDYATLMGGLKVLQGDESVVREAEVRMGMKATSLIDGLMNDLQKLQSGRSLQPNQRQAMINTIKTLTDLSKQQYIQSAAPILEQAQMEGIDPSILLSGSLSGANKASESEGLTTSKGAKTVTKKQYSPSRNKTKIIYSDGSEEIVDGKQ